MKLKPYPKYKESGVQWIGKIPESWEINRVKHICSKSAEYGLNEPAEKYVDEGIRFLRITDISENNRLIENGVYLPFKTINKEYLLNRGDVLIARSGSVGTSLYYDNKKHGVCSFAGYLVRFVANNSNDSKFLYYFTRSESFFAQIKLYSVQTTIENFNGQKYANMQIAVPSFQEQSLITSFLDIKSSEIDFLISKDQHLIDLLKEKRIALINHVVTKGLNQKAKLKDSGIEWIGETVLGWEEHKIKHFCSTTKGFAFKSEIFADSGVPVVKATDIKNETIIEGESFIPYELAKEFQKVKLHVEDIILSTVGSKPEVKESAVGQFAVVPSKFSNSLLNQNTVRLELDKTNKIRLSYFTYLLRTDSFRKYLDIHAHGTANQASLDIWDILEYKFFLPTPSEQLQISSYLDKETSKIDQTIEKIEKKIELMEEYKKSLIHHVVTGKVDVREATA
ncbi:MAG: restriction endonuclease subunit S [Candidatus Woesearchaeota archaeon]|nr:restriction endonuclease subunit S [Candidatus Woesearchaeota archaeon]